jgi:hypothetical protein
MTSSDALPDRETIRATLLAEYKPQGPVEMSVFDQLAYSAWVLKRLSDVEFRPADAKAGRILDRLAKYREHHRKMYDRSLASLKKLQTERATKNPRDLSSARREAPLADPERIEKALRRNQRARRLPLIDLAKLPPVTDLIQ